MGISACAEWLPEAHRLDMQEGNTIKLEQLESLEIGMTKDDVRKIMGSPMLSDRPISRAALGLYIPVCSR